MLNVESVVLFNGVWDQVGSYIRRYFVLIVCNVFILREERRGTARIHVVIATGLNCIIW